MIALWCIVGSISLLPEALPPSAVRSCLRFFGGTPHWLLLGSSALVLCLSNFILKLLSGKERFSLLSSEGARITSGSIFISTMSLEVMVKFIFTCGGSGGIASSPR